MSISSFPTIISEFKTFRTCCLSLPNLYSSSRACLTCTVVVEVVYNQTPQTTLIESKQRSGLTSMALIPRTSYYSPFLLRNPSLPLVRTHVCRSPVQSMIRVNSTFFTTKKRTFTVAAAAAASATPPPPPLDNAADLNFRRIAFSDVVVRKSRNAFWGRKWSAQDICRVVVMVMAHLLCLAAPFTFNWAAFWVAVAIDVVAGLLGSTLCYHRCLTHRSFKLPKWLEYIFAYCGVQALQWDPIDWVSTHRYHHQFCDTDRDPHSPLDGFWYSHMSWLFDSHILVQKCGEPNNVSDLEEQAFYKFIQKTYLLHPTALAVLLYAIGGMPFIVWSMGVRVVYSLHRTFFVNSICHIWGKQPWNTGDLSRNNWVIGLLAFGEGWHNNHHAFEYSARHGLEWWQIDTTWYVIKFLETVGLATDVKLPTDSQKRKMALGGESSQ